MIEERNAFPKRHLVTGLAILSVSLVAFLAYREILHYPFTANDTLTLIDTSRIGSMGDLWAILTQRMMAGSGFPLHYYRPITSLSFSLDYLVWRLEPFGYHLTDLVLHILVSVLVFQLARSLTRGKLAIAWLGAVWFSAHPVLVESIPASARRQGTLAALFLLLALLFFLEYQHKRPRSKLPFLMSLVWYVLALGAKETAVILPALAFAYVALVPPSDQSSPTSFRDRIKGSRTHLAAYLGVTLVYLVWRTAVLRGLGGDPDGPPIDLPLLLSITNDYYTALLDPYGLIGLEGLGYALILVCTLALVLLLGWLWFAVRRRTAPRVAANVWVFLSAVALVVLVGTLAHLFAPSLAEELGWGALSAALCLLACLMGIHQRRLIGDLFDDPHSAGLVAFLVVWLLLPLAIYLLTSVSNVYRTIYISIIPFSLLLALVLCESLEAVIRGLQERSLSPASDRPFSVKAITNVFVLAAAAGLSASLLAYSPLVHRYGEWEASGILSSLFLTRLSETAAQLPKGTTLHVYDLPRGIGHYERETPHATRVSYLADYSIKSWLELTLPGNQMEVVVHTRSFPEVLPSDLYLDVDVEGASATVRVRYVLPRVARDLDEALSLGIAYLEAGDYRVAIDLLQGYVASEPEYDGALSWLGQALYMAGDDGNAERRLLDSLGLNPHDNGKAYAILSQLYGDQNRHRDAERVCLQWQREMPEDAYRATRCLGWTYFFLGEHEEAIVQFRESLSNQPTANAYKGLVRSLRDGTGDQAEALKVALEWADSDEADSEAYYFMGQLYHALEEYMQAAGALERAIELGGLTQNQQVVAFATLGSSHAAADNLPAALQSYLWWVEASPESPEAHWRVAEVYARLGSCEEARQWLSVAAGLGLEESRILQGEKAIESCGGSRESAP